MCSNCGQPRPDLARPCPNQACPLSESYGEFMERYLAAVCADNPAAAATLATLAVLQAAGELGPGTVSG
jgi:hypothetical protein